MRKRPFAFHPASRYLVLGFKASFCLLVLLAAPSLPAAEKNDLATEAETRLYTSLKFLSSDEQEGRGIGTAGLDRAAEFLAAEFKQIGLKTDLIDGGPFQSFEMVTEAEMGKDQSLTFVAPTALGEDAAADIAAALGADFNPLAIGTAGKFDAPLVFVGYGITAEDANYDDYADIDVRGKAVIIMRHEPEQANPHSAFNGTDHSPHAWYTRKLANAYEHVAVAVIFCNDEFDIKRNVDSLRQHLDSAIKGLTAAQATFAEIKQPSREEYEKYIKEVTELTETVRDTGKALAERFDPVLGFQAAGPGESSASIPAVFCRREVLDQILQAAIQTTLAELEQKIDEGPAPQSRELNGWRLRGEIDVRRKVAQVKNVLGVLEGEGPLADETVIIGAHYDHLGHGGSGSLDPGSKEIHNGADDNASGTVALLEVARQLAARPEKLPRRVLFIAFTGEERGLIGSARYVKQPLFPLDKTVAMLNMDMVGRLDQEKLIIQGVDTSNEFGPLVDSLNAQYGFTLTKSPGGVGPSDHASFYPHNIPVMHFFTGTHTDYHRPSDDYDKVNLPGMRRIAEMVASLAAQISELPERPSYVEVKSTSLPGRGGDRPYFGSIPDFAQSEPGYALSGVSKGGPADKAGLKAGDIIIKLGEAKITNLEDFDAALRMFKAGDKAPVTVRREGKDVELEVILGTPR